MVVEDVREPLVDVYEEEDHVLVLAEIPGVSKKDVQLELLENRLTIRAQRGEKRYRKDVTLPEKFTQQNMQWDCTNGILKIRFETTRKTPVPRQHSSGKRTSKDGEIAFPCQRNQPPSQPNRPARTSAAASLGSIRPICKSSASTWAICWK